MILKLRKPKAWPYAGGSTGRPRGELPLGSRRVLVFEAIGEARDAYNDRVSKAILEYLHQNAHQLLASGSVVVLSLFMMGKSAEKTKPMVMFVSEDETARTEAFRMVNKSGIMKEFPGFEIGHMDLGAESEHLAIPGNEPSDGPADRTSTDIIVADSLRDVFTNKKPEGLLGGIRLHAHFRKDDKERLSSAVGGGIVYHSGTYYLHAVNHFLSPADNMEPNAPSSAASPTKEVVSSSTGPISWDATGLSDFDESSDDGDGDDLLQATSRGSATPESDLTDSQSPGSSASLPLNLDGPDHVTFPDELASRLGEVAVGANKGQPPRHCVERENMVRIGRVVMINKRLDSALIELDTSSLNLTESDLRDVTLPLSSFLDSNSTPLTKDFPVVVKTPEGESINGTLSATSSFLRLPHSKTFQTAYTAKLARPLSAGDCGTWVRHAATSQVLGYVVAGSSTTGQIILLPAKNIAETYSGSLKRGGIHQVEYLSEAVPVTQRSDTRDRRRWRQTGHPTALLLSCFLVIIAAIGSPVWYWQHILRVLKGLHFNVSRGRVDLSLTHVLSSFSPHPNPYLLNKLAAYMDEVSRKPKTLAADLFTPGYPSCSEKPFDAAANTMPDSSSRRWILLLSLTALLLSLAVLAQTASRYATAYLVAPREVLAFLDAVDSSIAENESYDKDVAKLQRLEDKLRLHRLLRDIQRAGDSLSEHLNAMLVGEELGGQAARAGV